MEQKPWTLRYREKQVVRQGTILATTKEMAEKVGHAYCNLDPARRFVALESPILQLEDGSLVDESLLSSQEVSEDWEVLTKVERIAKMRGKSTEEVLAEMVKKHKVSPRQLEESAQPKTAAK